MKKFIQSKAANMKIENRAEKDSADGDDLAGNSQKISQKTPFQEGIERFKKDKLAKFGLLGIIFLLQVAIFAPFLANGRPLLLFKGGTLSSPMLHFLFAPDSSEIIVEQFFNYLMLLSIVAFVLFLISRFITLKYIKTIATICAVLLLFPFFTTKQKLEKSNWRTLSADLEGSEFAIFAPVPYGPFENVAPPYQPPSSRHYFGTDKIGRDVLSRMIYGSRVSLAVGIFATGIAITVGIIIGLISGYFGGKTDFMIMRIVEIVICFPTFLLLLILMSIMMDMKFQQSILIVIGVIGITGWTGLTRLIRGETLKLRSLAFVQSCEALALPTWRIMLYHLLPNLVGIIMISFTFGIAGAILAESSLSFLGFGVQDPTASWGELLRQSFEDPKSYWHLTLFPGLALFIAVLSFNFAGEGLRKTLDPKG
jgi:peptide/nickel transport system permease protein